MTCLSSTRLPRPVPEEPGVGIQPSSDLRDDHRDDDAAVAKPVTVKKLARLDAAWRIPCDSPARLFNVGQLRERAELAERGLMDAMFIADFYIYRPSVMLEPITVLSALAAMTTRIGLIASVSTTCNEPSTSPACSRLSTTSASAARAGTR